MSKTSIPTDIRIELWVRAGGRCEKCNRFLLESITAPEIFNNAEVAHVIADSMKMVRGDKKLSKELAKNINNLMLLCPSCHTEIDKAQNEGFFTKEFLYNIKKEHEIRVKLLTGITMERNSHVIHYHAPIAYDDNIFTERRMKWEILPDYYTSHPIITLGMSNKYDRDNSVEFWKDEERNLVNLFKNNVRPLINNNDVERFLVFALAPIPLLVKLGSLLDDKISSIIYQKHRMPDKWRWLDEDILDFEYIIHKPKKRFDKVALNISLSGTINNQRIYDALDSIEVDIWTISINKPDFDFLKTKQQLDMFAITYNSVLDEIKNIYGQNNELYVFPACPNSIAVEMGRRWFKKSDLTMKLYDQNNSMKKFVYALEMKSEYQ